MQIKSVKLSLAGLAVCALLSACSPRMDHLFDKLMGHNSQTVILAVAPISIGPQGVSLVGKESMKVLGSSAGVCLVRERQSCYDAAGSDHLEMTDTAEAFSPNR